ncbi:MAG: hypothetical protein GY853_09605 [PVC group bacterium]|nr:hypothetical protein [PVC group bacterium]
MKFYLFCYNGETIIALRVGNLLFSFCSFNNKVKNFIFMLMLMTSAKMAMVNEPSYRITKPSNEMRVTKDGKMRVTKTQKKVELRVKVFLEGAYKN